MKMPNSLKHLLIGLANWMAGVCLMWGRFWNETAETQVTGKSRAEIRERRLAREGDDAAPRPPRGFRPSITVAFVV
jgi:hypothetical protein